MPQLTTAREGLDGIAIAMDPATSNNLVARIVVAGGRDGTTGTYVQHRTIESIGLYADGTTDAAWEIEGSQLTHARAYFALLTTQQRNETPFPPPPEAPPCGDCGGVIFRATPAASTTDGAPIYVVAAMGDDAFAASNNAGRSDFEACQVDTATGRLACGATWTVQTNDDTQSNFGHDAVMYFSYLYPFYAIQRETVGGAQTSIQLINSAIGRFPLLDPAAVINGQLLSNRQSASTSFVTPRAYYQMSRLLGYVYVVGGWIGDGPTGTIERHQQ